VIAPLLVDAEGYGRFTAGDSEPWRTFVHTGLRLTAWPAAEAGGAVLLFRPQADDPAFEPDALMTALTRDQLGVLIAELTALHAQL